MDPGIAIPGTGTSSSVQVWGQDLARGAHHCQLPQATAASPHSFLLQKRKEN